MRDLLVLAFVIASMYYTVRIPWIGVLSLAILAYLNPHRYAWGFSTSMPVFQLVFLAVVLSLIVNPQTKRPFPFTWETIIFFLLLTYFTITTYIFTPDYPGLAKEHWIKIMKIYIGIFPTFFLIRTREHFKWLVVIIAISFGLIGMKGGLFAIRSGFNYRVWGPDNTFYGGNNEIALAFNMVLPLILVSRKYLNNFYIKKFFLMMFILSIFSIISTHSRGGLVTLAVTILSLMLVGKKKWLIVTIPMVIAAGMIGPSLLPEEWTARMKTIETYDEDGSVQGRFMAWDYAMQRAAANPFSGGGFETFAGEAHDAHSAYFEILGEHGYVALLLWLSLSIGSLFSLQRRIFWSKRNPNRIWFSDYASAIQISILAYMVGSLFLGTAYWDILYHLIGLSVIHRILMYNDAAAQQI